jgi:tripartite-type tricarboxylate transporter receptor subunit TctC
MTNSNSLFRNAVGGLALALLAIGAPHSAAADDYPSKPITLIIPFAP